MKHVVVNYDYAGESDYAEFTLNPGESVNHFNMRARVAREIGADARNVRIVDWYYN